MCTRVTHSAAIWIDLSTAWTRVPRSRRTSRKFFSLLKSCGANAGNISVNPTKRFAGVTVTKRCDSLRTTQLIHALGSRLITWFGIAEGFKAVSVFPSLTWGPSNV